MRVHRRAEELPAQVASVVTMGTFDGVHLGHRDIIRAVRRIARESGLRSVVITFDPHPREVLGTNGTPLFLLTTVEERLALIEHEGIDVCLVIPFTRAMSLESAEDFFADMIAARACAKHVVVGFDHKFGTGRGADAGMLMRFADAAGIRATVVPAQTLDGAKISSTEIRASLKRGDVVLANRMLGRPFSLQGIVVRGEGLGARMGVPTANVHLDSVHKLVPRRGVYAVEADLGGAWRRGVANIGTRPTFSGGENRLSIEVHLFEFSGDAYGLTATVAFHERLRDEMRFPDAGSLVEQIRRDAEEAQRFFSKRNASINQ